MIAQPTPAHIAAVTSQEIANASTGTSYVPYGTRCKNANHGFQCTTFVIDYSGHPMTFHCWAYHADAHGNISEARDFTRLASCPEHLPRPTA